MESEISFFIHPFYVLFSNNKLGIFPTLIIIIFINKKYIEFCLNWVVGEAKYWLWYPQQ